MTYRFRNPELHQEEDVVVAWKVVLAVLVTLVISAALVVWAVSALADDERDLRPSGGFPEKWIGPRHTVAQVREDLFGERVGASLDGRERAELEGWGWVDRERRVVHIPIERAIDLVVQGSGR